MTIRRHDFVVVADRLPVEARPEPDGSHTWALRTDNAASMLIPTAREHRAAWVGWPGPVDAGVPPGVQDDIALHPVTLSADQVRDYQGFSNATISALYHEALQRPIFEGRLWNAYVRTNQRFTDAAAEVAGTGATVWIFDYPLQLVPVMLRELRPDLKIGFFLDLPFPPTELFRRLPWRTEVVRGLLGADLIGFHRPGAAQNFLWLARRLVGLQPSRGMVGVRTRPGVVQYGDREVRVGAFPSSIDSAAFDARARSNAVQARAREIRTSLGSPRTVILGLERFGHIAGTDRLDYSLGIDLRLRALHDLLIENRLTPEEISILQVSVLDSTDSSRQYEQLRQDIERIARRINQEFAHTGRPLVQYVQRPLSPDELTAFYCAADVLTVTPLRSGMNLISKEYVASRYNLDGALVLSEFTGAAAELTSSFLINPHDLDGVKNAVQAAVTVDPGEGRRRMKALRRQVLTHDVDRWARSFLDVLGLQQAERL